MAGFGSVFLKSGEQPRYFNFGQQDNIVLSISANADSQPLIREGLYETYQAILLGTGAVTATINIRGTNDPNTGQGFILGGMNTVTNPVNLNGTTTVAGPGNFTQALVGALVIGNGIPVGTTVSTVAADGRSLVMSNAATITASGTPVMFYAQNWVATALGTITLNGTGNLSDGFTTSAPWRWVRAEVSNITGTVSSVQVIAGC